MLKPGQKYKHYKGNFYEILDIARDSDSLEEVVVYRGLYEDKEFGKNPLWVRPKKEFLEKVVWQGKEVDRFTKISNKQGKRGK